MQGVFFFWHFVLFPSCFAGLEKVWVKYSFLIASSLVIPKKAGVMQLLLIYSRFAIPDREGFLWPFLSLTYFVGPKKVWVWWPFVFLTPPRIACVVIFVSKLSCRPREGKGYGWAGGPLGNRGTSLVAFSHFSKMTGSSPITAPRLSVKVLHM